MPSTCPGDAIPTLELLGMWGGGGTLVVKFPSVCSFQAFAVSW